MLIFRIHQYGFCQQGTLIIKPMTTKEFLEIEKVSRLITTVDKSLFDTYYSRNNCWKSETLRKMKKERKFLLEQLVTRSAVLPSWPKSNMPVLPAAPVSKASENLTCLNENGTRFKGWSKLLQD